MKMKFNPNNNTFALEELSALEISNIGAALTVSGEYDKFSKTMAADFEAKLGALLSQPKPQPTACFGNEVQV